MRLTTEFKLDGRGGREGGREVPVAVAGVGDANEVER